MEDVQAKVKADPLSYYEVEVVCCVIFINISLYGIQVVVTRRHLM